MSVVSTGDFASLRKHILKNMHMDNLEMPRLKGKNRFRALVRMVIANIIWLAEASDTDKDMEDNVKLKVILLKRKKGTKNVLTIQEKILFKKPSTQRTPEEINYLHSILQDLKCFRRYPEDVQRKLAGATYFMYYGENRVIMRQGHDPHALYFILSGEVTISQTIFDKILNESVTTVVGSMIPGDLFGEVSLLHDVQRTATVTTVTPVELLCLWKNDFDRVLKHSLVQLWEERQSAMKKFPYFDTWSEVAIRELCILSKTRSYEENEILLGQLDKYRNHVFFLISGLCSVIQKLNILVSETNGKQVFRLNTDKVVPRPGEISKLFFMQICIFREGACFGLGEDLRNRQIISLTKVDCLICPRHWIMQNNQANIWVRIRQFLDQQFPTTEQVFRSFIENRRWLKYKQKVIDDILREKHIPLDTSMHDVPYSIRLSEHISF